MKKLTPNQILIWGSVLVAIFSLLMLLLARLVDAKIPTWIIVTAPIAIGTFAALVFYFFVSNSINQRIKLLYRTIRTGKMKSNEQFPEFSLEKDIISKVETETQSWLEEKQKEVLFLKEQADMRREFLGNLAHELKTPVFSIQGYILTLLDGGLEDESVNRTFLERASKATDRIVNLLEDLDQITKLESGQLLLSIRPFDIVELCREVAESLALIAERKEYTIKMAKEYKPIFVNADRQRIAQVLTNLLNNAVYYGNIKGRVQIRIYVLDDVVSVEISDDGPGIAQQHFPRLFERFYRVEKSRNRNEGGSGLGLSIVKHIIEAHQHTVSVRSTVGEGSTFTFSLDKSKSSPTDLFSSKGIL